MIDALTIAFLLAASPIHQTPARGVVVSGGGSPTYLIKQGFEGTGYDNSETWTTSIGTPLPDYTTSPAPLVDSQSLMLDTATNGCRVRVDFANQTTAWFYGQLHMTGSLPPGFRNLVDFSPNGVGTQNIVVEVSSTGTLTVNIGGSRAQTVGTMSIGTTYHMWAKHVKGSANDAVLEAGFSTDGTEPTSGNNFVSKTDGTTYEDTGRVALGYTAATTFNMIWDKVRVDDADIGSNPE